MTLAERLRRRSADSPNGHGDGSRSSSESSRGRSPGASGSSGSSSGSSGEGSRASETGSGTSLGQRISQFDLRNTWQVAAGAILIPLGVAIIGLAWYGAAHAGYVQQQMPYLVSGSFVGLGCMVVGGLFFWAHWLYRIYDQADLHHQEQMEAQREMVAVLVDLVRDQRGLTAPSGSAPGSSGESDGDGLGLVATPSGTFYHLPTCPVAQQRRDKLRPVEESEARSMRPCRICDPPCPA